MKKNSARGKRSPLTQLLAGEALEVFDDLAMPRIELNGKNDAVVDGCRGVLEYNEGAVLLNCGRVSVRFCGASLSINNLAFNKLIVSGDICSVEFSS